VGFDAQHEVRTRQVEPSEPSTCVVVGFELELPRRQALNRQATLDEPLEPRVRDSAAGPASIE